MNFELTEFNDLYKNLMTLEKHTKEYKVIETRFYTILKNYLEQFFYKSTFAGEREDLVDGAVIKAFLNLDKYNPEKGAFSTWVTHLAKNYKIDLARHRKIKPQHYANREEIHEDYLTTSKQPSSIDYKALKNVINTTINNAFTNRPLYLQIFELRAYDELSYEEISNKLKIPVGSVKGSIFRVRRVLSKKALSLY